MPTASGAMVDPATLTPLTVDSDLFQPIEFQSMVAMRQLRALRASFEEINKHMQSFDDLFCSAVDETKIVERYQDSGNLQESVQEKIKLLASVSDWLTGASFDIEAARIPITSDELDESFDEVVLAAGAIGKGMDKIRIIHHQIVMKLKEGTPKLSDDDQHYFTKTFGPPLKDPNTRRPIALKRPSTLMRTAGLYTGSATPSAAPSSKNLGTQQSSASAPSAGSESSDATSVGGEAELPAWMATVTEMMGLIKSSKDAGAPGMDDIEAKAVDMHFSLETQKDVINRLQQTLHSKEAEAAKKVDQLQTDNDALHKELEELKAAQVAEQAKPRRSAAHKKK